MANDLQASISTRLGRTLSDMTRVKRGLGGIEDASKRLNRTASATNGALDKQQRALRVNSRMSAEAGTKLQKLSEAVSRLGGPVAALAGQIGGGAGMGGKLGRLAVGFGLVSAAGVAFGKVTEANIDRTQKAIEAEERYTAALKEGRKARQAQSEAGLSQEEEQRLLIARGGPDAVREATEVQRRGISRSQATRGVADAQLLARDPEARQRLIEAAVRAASTGEIDFASAIQGLGDRRSQSLLADRRTDEQAIARAISAQTGRRFTIGDLLTAEKRVGASAFLRQADLAQGVDADIDATTRERVESGEAAAQARIRLGETRSPVAAAVNRQLQESQRQTAILDRLADEQGALVGFLRDLFSTQGSFATQAARRRNATEAASALFGSGD